MRLKTSVFIALFGAVASGGCATDEEPPEKQRPAKRVEIETVRADSLTDLLTLPGTIQAREATTLATGRGGRIDSIAADEGDRVTQGQALVRINAGTAYAELEQAKAAHDSAAATHERIERLTERKLSSDAQLETARATLAQARAALELARANLSYAVVRAPHAGYIAKRHVSVGEFATPGSPLLELVDIDTVEVITKVPERDIDTIEKDATASFTVDALNAERFTGTVNRVGIIADPAARTFEVEVRVKNSENRLKPGMLARVSLPRRSLENVPVIRRDAVVEDLNGPTVFIARDNEAHRVPVRLGPVSGDRVAVAEGLEPGMPLIVVGQRMLVEGEPIKIVGEALETAKLPETAEPADESHAVTVED